MQGQDRKVLFTQYFEYSFFIATLTNGTVAPPATITIQADSDFAWQKTAYFVTTSAHAGIQQNARCLPEIAVQFQNSGSGRLQYDRALPLGAIAGDGQFPFILPNTEILKAKTTFQMTAANYGTTDYINLYVTLIGTKIFYEE